MGFVFSPSNLMSYAACPKRFWGQSISKTIKWKASSQKSRGTLVHSCLQKAVDEGMAAVKNWPDGLDGMRVQQVVDSLRALGEKGAKVWTEHEMVVGKDMKPAKRGWWDEDAFFRCKADVCLLSPEGSSALLIDWKTGRKWDENAMQLRAEALLVHLFHGAKRVTWSYEYVDTGETTRGVCDFTNGLAPVQDIVHLMKDARQAIKTGAFLPQKNRFCRFCDFHQTPLCGL